MADGTKIEWTDATWSPVTGCSVVSPGCTNCYAMRLAGTRLKHHPSREGLTTPSKAGPVWNGQVHLNEDWLADPLKWTKPRRIFVCAHGDLFHEAVPDTWIDRVFAIMALCPQHTFQVLTKRPERMRAYVTDPTAIRRVYELVCDLVVYEQVAKAVLILPGTDPDAAPPGERIFLNRWPLPNVWKGVSVEDQVRADERIPILLDTPAVVRWISAEPLLGAVNIRPWLYDCYECSMGCGCRLAERPNIERCEECGEECGFEMEPVFSDGCPKCGGELEAVCPDCNGRMVYQHPDTPYLDWVVVGGESGPGARPMHPDWARQIRDDCAGAGVPFLFKQWGAWAPCPGGDGEWPADAKNHCRLLKDGGRGPAGWPMQRVGKKAAGRLLDGVLHDAMPAGPDQ